MRKILILILICFSVYNLIAQNSEPKPMTFIWGGIDTLRLFDISDTNSQFKQTEFLTGYQWTGTPRFNKLMKNNANAGSASIDTNFERSKEPTCRFFTSFRKVGKKPTI